MTGTTNYKMNMKYSTLIIALFVTQSMFAYKYVGWGNPDDGGGQTDQQSGVLQQTRAAACAPATGLQDLEWNNVKALIETGGSMWQDRSISQAAYEVPKGGGVSSLYAGALWMGGISPDQQLKLAAITFRANGNDYWPGPLTNDGTAEVTEDVCEQYDQFFTCLRQDSQRHYQYHQAVINGTVEEEFPDGYTMPSYFQDYPAIGNTALDQDYFLSTFYDFTGNDI